MPAVQLAMTARDKILKPYIDNGIPHEFRTTPVTVTGQLVATFVSGGTLQTYGWFKFNPQKVKFARKGLGDITEFGRASVEATEAETNLQRGGSTDGARDMAIEGLSLSACGTLINYFNDGPVAGFGVAPSDETVLAALNGRAAMCDPFGLIKPAQLESPYLLEEAIYTALMRHCSIRLELDTSRPFNLGRANLYPGAAGQSPLRANGLPQSSNLFGFPEGILWQRDGKPDSDLVVTLELHRPLVVPVSLVTLPGGAAVREPVSMFQRVSIDLRGVSVTETAVN